MVRIASVLMIGYALLGCLNPVAAGGLEASKSLLCQSDEGREYHPGGRIKPFNPESVGLAKKFVIDFKQGIVRPTADSYVHRRSRIQKIAYVENKIILLGAEDGIEGVDDGVGWAAAISRDTGRFTISAAGQGVGYIVFGVCTAE
jgi:hypothetical protein